MRRNVILGLLFGVVALWAAPATGGSGVLRLRERLESLDPAAPMRYFELAEEVAYEQPEDVELARTLFVLSFELARRRDPQTALGPSVCLALADLSTSSTERRWLRSLARSMTAGGGAVAPIVQEETDITPAVAEALAQALVDFHAGEYRSALERIERDARVLAALERLATPIPGGANRIMDELRSEPQCRRCRNRRTVRAPGVSDGETLCPICGGNPGPDLTDDELIDLLRMVSTLLGGTGSTWSAQYVLDGGRPLRDIDPDELAPWFGVDPRATGWDAEEREWVRPGEAGRAPEG